MTVSLLESFAVRSPRSHVPVTGEAKCVDRAVLDPPAAIPQRERKDPLRQSAMTRIDPGYGRRTPKGRRIEFRSGESASRVMAVSLRISAAKR
jgi:hypothetical protein